MSFGKLFICPTPIGNLGDITVRTLDALRSADTVCAEDTRVTGKLLAAYNIEKRVERLDEEMLSKKADAIIERIVAGETIAYCSDAGMPGVSDPGLRLVRAAQDAGVSVEVLPGASAGVLAYVASGFTNQQFFFGGFLPRKIQEMEEDLRQLKRLDAVLIFYESPKRLVNTLDVIARCFPQREVAVCRELTKRYEEVYRGFAPEVYEAFLHRAQKGSIKGEIVIAIDAASQAEQEDAARDLASVAQLRAQELKTSGALSNKDIIKRLQEEYGLARNTAYDIVLSL